jgi:hypothetical protein
MHHLCTAPVLTAAVLAALCQYAPDPAEAQTVAGVRVRVDALKKSTFEQTSLDGPVLVGPQPALELEWRVLNKTGEMLEIPSPGAVLLLRVAGQGREIPVRTEWAPDMAVRAPINGEPVSTMVPLGAATLPDGSSLWVRGSTKALDGSAFAPGDYVLELDVRDLQQVSLGGARTVATVDRGFRIQLRILELNSPERQRQFHMIEGAFYKGSDSNRALEHYAALASLRGAPWSDSLPLAWMYGELGRHRDASVVFRRILPDLLGALDGPLGDTLRNARHLRRAAMSFAVEGDVATAANLLRLEGSTPEARIPGEIERLRKSAPKAGGNPK